MTLTLCWMDSARHQVFIPRHVFHVLASSKARGDAIHHHVRKRLHEQRVWAFRLIPVSMGESLHRARSLAGIDAEVTQGLSERLRLIKGRALHAPGQLRP